MAKPNYLHELLGALSETELERLRLLELKGKEHALLEYYLDQVGKPTPTKEQISFTLSMSSPHIDKTSSIVLQKSYGSLVPTSSSDLWVFLRKKRLIRHLYHEFTIEERELLKANNNEALAQFYFDAFEVLHTMSFQDYDPDEATRFMNRYFELKPNASAAERIMIEGRYIRQRITNGQAVGKIDDSLKSLKDDLTRLEASIDDTIPSLSICQFYLAYAHYYKVVAAGEIERQRYYLQKTLDIMEREYDDYTDEDRQLMRCKIADTYYQASEFEKAYSMYKKIVPQYPEIFKVQFFFTSTFAQLSILCNDFSNTDKIIGDHYLSYLAQGADGQQPATTAAIQLVKRYLLDDNLKEARRYIDLGFEANNKGVLTSFEIELRKLEALYFIIAGDFGFAEELIDKHIKFIQSKGLSVKTNSHGIFFKLLRAIITERSGGKKLSAELETQLATQSQGFWAIYGRLLEKVRAR